MQDVIAREEADAAAVASQLRPITDGSEKQNAWASKIRAEYLAKATLPGALRDFAGSIVLSRWWIDNRERLTSTLLWIRLRDLPDAKAWEADGTAWGGVVAQQLHRWEASVADRVDNATRGWEELSAVMSRVGSSLASREAFYNSFGNELVRELSALGEHELADRVRARFAP